MARKKPKADKMMNQCRDNDVSLPLVRAKAKRPESAADLNDGQILLLAELWAKNGGCLASRVYSLFGFHPTEEDRAHLYWAVSIREDLGDTLESIRLGWWNWKARQHERGRYPLLMKDPPPRRGEPGWVNFDRRERPVIEAFPALVGV